MNIQERYLFKLGRKVELLSRDENGEKPCFGTVSAVGRHSVTVHFPNGCEETFDKADLMVVPDATPQQ